MDAVQQSTTRQKVTIGLGPILAFVLLACGLAWLVALPLWLGDGLASPLTGVLLPLMMFTPALALLIVMFTMHPIPKGERLRFLGMWPLRPAKRVVWMMVIGLFGTVAVVVAAMLLSVALGWLSADFIGLSGFAQTLESSVPAGTPLPPAWVLVAVQLASIPFAAATINAVMAFGEEVGWRGFLVPALRRYGTWPALLISGAIWGVWHAPVILLGYNFGRTDITGVLLMTAGCIVWGVLLGWLRLRSASMWPAVFAHGALNAAAGLPIVFLAAGAVTDPALSMALGASGWIVGGAIIVVLLLTGQFRQQPNLAEPKPRASVAPPVAPPAPPVA
ncbi:CPBP family intramembrane metalloprotease [Microbacterium esteraromaticum]|uniref:CPBP family intramembrane glutamic endopeptidase n=1 Tax=Microbacterium esteraromaticum TaxID=57043 RepID=UPI0019D395FD|nr:CPBP family intramembrane glutamic endopeptidase [Microbacterium esteraromaticum]MBN7793166.1 CPBP family intramembrane metalloprotease [Microbacterium esteraromaticum]MCA1305714.1 CPBP family intramembrane metalloprotease [Microbacterium esteraromaticum]